MLFTVITTYHIWNEHKKRQLKRTIDSVLNQTYEDFEFILVDDGTPEPNLPELPNDPRINTFKVPHLERIIALNKGLAEAKGEWIVFIDADDELLSYTLLCMSQMIEKYPESKVFNFGSIHVRGEYGTVIRGPFKPEQKDVGHVVFGGGTVVNGTFIFKRECYEALGGFPHHWNMWDFSVHAQKEFPEIKPFFTHKHPDHPEGQARELGNPWGQDYYMFYKLTRKYHSKPFDMPLVLIHHEGREEGSGHRVP